MASVKSEATAKFAPKEERFGDMADYASLKRVVKQKGLLEKQPAYYTYKISLTAAMLLLSLGLVFVVDHLALHLLNAVFLAFISTQIAFLGHDLGHRQIFRSAFTNDAVSLFVVNLLNGGSHGWWVDKHNAHHSNPNQLDLDPDVDIPVLAFTEEQALERQGIFRFIVKHQAIFLFPMMCFQAYGMHNAALQTLFRIRPKYFRLELVLIALHFALYLSVIFWQLGLGYGLLFIVVHKALMGLYLASVFAPNHKGMPVLDKDSQLDFLRRQVITARNVKGHPLTDFWYGGLNYQVEHHLFPSMPRNRLREAQIMVQAFCAEKGIEYYETSMLQSYQEILAHLHEVSAVLRTPTPEPATSA